MTRIAIWNGITFASFIAARNAAQPHVDAAAGVYQPITVLNEDGSVYNVYTLGKAPPKPATVVAPAQAAPSVDVAALVERVAALETEAASQHQRIATLEAVVAELVSAAAAKPRRARGKAAA